MTITRAQIQSLLLPIADKAFSMYNTWPDLHNMIYESRKSDRAVEYDIELSTLPMAQFKADGAPLASESMGQVFQNRYVNQYYGIAFEITRAAVKDNLYKDAFPRQMEAVRKSLQTVKNVNAMYLFNNANNMGSVGSDGQPLLSTQHPIQGGVLANTFTTGMQLSESSIEDLISLMGATWKNYAGLPIVCQPKKLLVNNYLEFKARRILKSEYQTATANNDINALKSKGYLQGSTDIVVTPFLTNKNAWFITTDQPDSFKYFLRESLEVDFMTDPRTYNVLMSAIERYSFGYSTWRGCIGSMGI